MDTIELPDTDSPEVMQQVISLWLTKVIWDEYSRGIQTDDTEKELLGLYTRVREAVRTSGPA